MNWFLQRMAEPSTWAGAAVVAGAVGEQLAQGGGIVGAGVAALAMILGERGRR